jgi:hypothetical protein
LVVRAREKVHRAAEVARRDDERSIVRMSLARVLFPPFSAESGHSIAWEQPEFFNEKVLAFIARH